MGVGGAIRSETKSESDGGRQGANMATPSQQIRVKLLRSKDSSAGLPSSKICPDIYLNSYLYFNGRWEQKTPSEGVIFL